MERQLFQVSHNGQNNNRILFGLYDQNGGTRGEMSVEWNGDIPQLQIFDDAWSILNSFQDVFAEMGKVNNQNITPEQFSELLKSCGFREQP